MCTSLRSAKHHTALREPTVKRQCVPCFDVNDARRVLLIDQRTDKRDQDGSASGPAARPTRAAALSYVRSMMSSLRAGMPGKEDRYVQRAEHQRAVNRLNYPQRDIVRHGT